MSSQAIVSYGYQGNFRYDTNDKQEFVGLSNQGATCYMNSLLQTLFLTPEFRREIYRWRYDSEKHGEQEDCIPLQLQLLFGKLQLSDSLYIETTGLTKSFQWDIRDSFQQHDVQEFCRVLFDAIEQSVEGTEQANMIKQLYEGTYVDYVKCMNCSHESSREDKFLDLSLTVKNIFDKIYNDSVEKALESYIRPEELTGENQYFCEKCNSKQDALKGLKFKELPYIMALQLKRFDLDLQTFSRIKLNDEVRFPQILNMNSYLKGTLQTAMDSAKPGSSSDEEESPIADLSPTDIDNCDFQLAKFSSYDTIMDDDEKKPLKLDPIAKKKQIERRAEIQKQERAKLIEEYREDGENVYELFSVMIHSGSALGGHYYAYIKSFENERWYNFNDSIVKEIDEKDIEKVFGGTSKSLGYWGSSYSSNAYLLMYRKVDESKNISRIESSEVPEYILEVLEKEKEKEEEEARERAEKLKKMKLRVFYKGKEKQIEMNKDALLKELKKKALEEFEIQEISNENVRVRGYSQYYDIFQEVFNEEKSLENLGLYSHRLIALETKKPSEEFEEYDPLKVTIKVNVWDEETCSDPEIPFEQKTSNPSKFQVEKRETVRKLMQFLEEKFKVPFAKQKLLKKGFASFSQTPEVISARHNLDQSISMVRIYEGCVLYLESVEDHQAKSKWQKLLEEEANKITIKFNHPDQKPNVHGQLDFKESVVIQNKKTLQDLKKEIASKINLEVDEFIMKRGSRYGAETKDMSLKLSQANIVNNNLFFIERGTPSRPDELRLIFHLALPAKPTDCDGASFSFAELFQLPVHLESRIKQVKEKVAERLEEMYPSMEVDPEKMRLREKYNEKMNKVLKDQEMIRQYHMFDKKNIGVQLLEEPDKKLEYSEIIVIVRKWSPSTWELTSPKEIIINKHWRLHEFGENLSKTFEIPVSST